MSAPEGFKPGDYVRAKRHDGTRAGGPQAPIWILREAIRWRSMDDGSGRAEPYQDGTLERLCVVSHHPYRRGMVMPFNEGVIVGEGLIKVPAPMKKVPPSDKRSDRSGTRRRSK